MVTILTGAILLAMGTAEVGVVAFACRYYMRARWYSSEIGRNLMEWSIVMILLLALPIFNIALGQSPTPGGRLIIPRLCVSLFALVWLNRVIWRRLVILNELLKE